MGARTARTGTEMNSATLVKIHFTLDATDWHGQGGESLWGKPVGGPLYELQNSPFFATGVSYLDIVNATMPKIPLNSPRS